MARALALLPLVILLAGCGPKTAPSVRIDPALATLVPGDTVLMAGIRLDALRATPAYRKLAPEALGPVLGGLDLKDVWEVLAVSNGRDFAALARGRYSTTGLEPEGARPGEPRTSYKGYTLIGTESAMLAYVNPTTAVVGRGSGVRSVLDQRGRSSGPPAALASEIAAIAPDNQVWAVGLGEASRAAPRSGNLSNLGTALNLVERFHAAADLRSGARLKATALCHNAQDTESLAAALRAFLAFAGISNPEFRTAAAALKITATNATVEIDGLIPESALEQLLR